VKFPSGKLPAKHTQYTIDYQFSDGSVRTDIFVEILSPDILMVYHPGEWHFFLVIMLLCDSSFAETLQVHSNITSYWKQDSCIS